MSPMLVYFLMMADDIKSMFALVAGVATLVAAMVWFTRVVIFEMDGDTPKAVITASRRLPWVIAAAVCLNTFIPNTRTIAAMIVLPKLTSPAALDAMGGEAKELYNLAKDALRNLASDEKPASGKP